MLQSQNNAIHGERMQLCSTVSGVTHASSCSNKRRGDSAAAVAVLSGPGVCRLQTLTLHVLKMLPVLGKSRPVSSRSFQQEMTVLLLLLLLLLLLYYLSGISVCRLQTQTPHVLKRLPVRGKSRPVSSSALPIAHNGVA
jgi:hypothetical protein